jgi:NADH dehydrogenase
MEDVAPLPLLVTGANGHLGVRLVARLHAERPVRAVVRSAAARDSLLRAVPGAEVRVVDYADAAALAAAAAGCGAIVHLVGILREARGVTYENADAAPMRALLGAATAAGIARIVYLSIAGADVASPNRCLASRGHCERLLCDGAASGIVLRVPMVLGEGDYASAALARHARGRLCVQFRAASLEQPIDAEDVVSALVAAAALPPCASRCLTLAGPESLPRRALIARAGRILGTRPRVLSLPLAAGILLARLLEWLLPRPPLTVAMLGVLDHDDVVDAEPVARELGITLTPLDDTLARVLVQPAGAIGRISTTTRSG